ncbi:hypothetical protein LEL_07133 [Akanthomyces lecanii RCEF 1005]|uniref:Uncharacterized protein n=1 Tax=Akanthomyces lecanii RCEF 1005 TaxID=1081108 RepID=A0A168FG80_CORDF|nr:hypothetical protein LEL_07133 [Akanthomyces lecanii RCEF 1005]
MAFYDRNEQNQYFLEQSRYEIATAVLYGISFLAGLAVCVLAFIKLRGGSLGHGFASWLRLACIFFTLSCVLGMCANALSSPLVHQAGTGEQEYSLDRLFKQNEAAQYMRLIASWFHHVTQGILFIAIVTFCAATSATTSSKVWLVVVYVLGSVLNGLAAAMFALGVKQNRNSFDNKFATISLFLTLRDVTLAFDCIMAAAALFAAGFAVSRLSKSMHINDKPAKLAALASILLLLSALYQLSVLVNYSWVNPPHFGVPNYLSILGMIFDTWALLGATALVFVAGKNWSEGGSVKQQKGSAA